MSVSYLVHLLLLVALPGGPGLLLDVDPADVVHAAGQAEAAPQRDGVEIIAWILLQSTERFGIPSHHSQPDIPVVAAVGPNQCSGNFDLMKNLR